MVIVLAWASMPFSTNSAIAFNGLLCERAMMRIAFQSSPILSLPGWDGFPFRAAGRTGWDVAPSVIALAIVDSPVMRRSRAVAWVRSADQRRSGIVRAAFAP